MNRRGRRACAEQRLLCGRCVFSALFAVKHQIYWVFGCTFTNPYAPQLFRRKAVVIPTDLGEPTLRRSLGPVELTCFYLMLGLPRITWERFGLWLLVGLALYFL